MANGIYKITEEFEQELCKYTGAKYAVTVDNMSNALFLSLYYEHNIKNRIKNGIVGCPSRTYPSVPCEIIHAGLKIEWTPIKEETLTGAYQLTNSRVWDSALRFTADMFIPKSHMCVSFTGPYKHFKLSKGGAILTDDYKAYLWFKRARYSGRRECSYHDDNLDMLGWNFYMMPELAARGLLLMGQFYNVDGTKKHNEDLTLPYPDLSKFKVYTQ
jgi:dTDP-4-amino-4,6-dideoxygalactose transaminase